MRRGGCALKKRSEATLAAQTGWSHGVEVRESDHPVRSKAEASVRQAKPGLSRKLKGAYPWNNPFIKVAEQACGIGVIRVTKPCEANS